MINNPLLTKDSINENASSLKKTIFEELEKTLRATGIKVTPEAKEEIEEKIKIFVNDVYTKQCRYRHHLNTKDP